MPLRDLALLWRPRPAEHRPWLSELSAPSLLWAALRTPANFHANVFKRAKDELFLFPA